jgi:hypothetical protein
MRRIRKSSARHTLFCDRNADGFFDLYPQVFFLQAAIQRFLVHVLR